MLPQIHAHLPTQLGGAAANQVLQMSHPATHAGLDHFKIRACGTCCLRHECKTSDNQIQNNSQVETWYSQRSALARAAQDLAWLAPAVALAKFAI